MCVPDCILCAFNAQMLHDDIWNGLFSRRGSQVALWRVRWAFCLSAGVGKLVVSLQLSFPAYGSAVFIYFVMLIGSVWCFMSFVSCFQIFHRPAFYASLGRSKSRLTLSSDFGAFIPEFTAWQSIFLRHRIKNGLFSAWEWYAMLHIIKYLGRGLQKDCLGILKFYFWVFQARFLFWINNSCSLEMVVLRQMGIELSF